MKIMIRERAIPAIAMPRGALNKPTKEKIRPKNQRIKLIIINSAGGRDLRSFFEFRV